MPWGKDKAFGWLKVLDESLLGPRGRFLCSDDIESADYPRSMMALSGEAVDCRFGPNPNVPRWLGNMKALKSRAQVNEAFYQCVTAPSKWKKLVRSCCLSGRRQRTETSDDQGTRPQRVPNG